MIDKYDIPYEWYNNLCTTGTLPTKEDIMRTVGNRCGCLDINAFRCKDLYNSKFGFALLSQETVNDMAKFFDGCTVLEVGAGSGFLAKAISDANISIKMIATDSGEWENSCKDEWKKHFSDVLIMDGIDAISAFADNIDYVLMSWPPYDESMAYEILNKCIEVNKPLVYIGEWECGCNGDNEFFELINKECDVYFDTVTENYVPFGFLYDDVYLIKGKGA